MPGKPSSPSLRLPRQWKKRVRSAVLHAISLAQFALTSARGQIQRRDHARDRRFAELERLRQEIRPLKEELHQGSDGREVPRVRGRRGQCLDVAVSYMAGRKHLPIVELKKAA